MRISEFWQLVDDEFGSGHGRMLVRSHTLRALGHITGQDAIDAGQPLRSIWVALCREMDVPESRWLGVDRPAPRGGRRGGPTG
ncbi:DUF3046 domain-containing protein [Calidifontibacter terrae]